MTEDCEFAEEKVTAYQKLRVNLGLYAIDIGTALFIRPACKLLMIKPVNSNQMWSILHRYDAERRYSRAGLLLMESFNRAYLAESPLPSDCVNCDFSADYDDKSCVCRHPKAKEFRVDENPVKNFDPVPEFCPIKTLIERENNQEHE